MKPADPRYIKDEVLHAELATVLAALHTFAHRTEAPAGTNVIEWVRIVHEEAIARAIRFQRSGPEIGTP